MAIRQHAPVLLRIIALFVIGLIVSESSPVSADAASAARLSAVVARILSYERSLPNRAGPAVNILVLHAGGNAASLSEARAFERGFASMTGSTIQGLPIQTSVMPYSSGVIVEGVDVLILCAGLESQIDAITAVSRRRHLMSVGVERAYATRATALAVVVEEGRPKIIANLAHARAEGVQLSSQLLRLAEVL
jgi:hypothetical protein